MTSNAATVYKFSDLKLQPLAQLRDATDVESGNEVRGVQWEKLQGACHLCRESDNKDSRSTLSTLL